MSASFAHSPFMPCPACGASVAVATATEHTCELERRLDFELFQLREEILGLDLEIEEYLTSARGRFEQWYASYERQRPDDAPPGPRP